MRLLNQLRLVGLLAFLATSCSSIVKNETKDRTSESITKDDTPFTPASQKEGELLPEFHSRVRFTPPPWGGHPRIGAVSINLTVGEGASQQFSVSKEGMEGPVGTVAELARCDKGDDVVTYTVGFVKADPSDNFGSLPQEITGSFPCYSDGKVALMTPGLLVDGTQYGIKVDISYP